MKRRVQVFGVLLAVMKLGAIRGGHHQPVAEVETGGDSDRGPARRYGHKVLIGAVALIVGIAGGAAYGYFVSSGSGTGSASTGSIQVTINAQTGTPNVSLVPGGSGDLVFQVKNENPAGNSIVSVALNGTIIPDSGHSGCTTTNSNPVVTLSIPGADLPVSLVANTASQQIDLANAVTMDATATSNCQGATFSVPITITVKKG